MTKCVREEEKMVAQSPADLVAEVEHVARILLEMEERRPVSGMGHESARERRERKERGYAAESRPGARGPGIGIARRAGKGVGMGGAYHALKNIAVVLRSGVLVVLPCHRASARLRRPNSPARAAAHRNKARARRASELANGAELRRE